MEIVFNGFNPKKSELNFISKNGEIEIIHAKLMFDEFSDLASMEDFTAKILGLDFICRPYNSGYRDEGGVVFMFIDCECAEI